MMLTVSELKAFDSAPWTKAANTFGVIEVGLRTTGLALEARALALRLNWFDPIGQMVGERMDLHADKYGEEASKLTGVPGVLLVSATSVDTSKGSMDAWLVWAGRFPYDVAENGQVSVRWQEVPNSLLVRAFHRTNAPVAAINIRSALFTATGTDLIAAAALAKVRESDLAWPPGFDGGPIDMSDQGISDSLIINEQDDYGDCTLLSAITALGVTDPEWARRNVRWDDKTQTYTVTIFDQNGNKIDVVVDPRKLPQAGAHNSSNTRRPTLASIIEEAVRQHYPNEVENGFWHHEAYQALTGKSGDSSTNTAPTIEDVTTAVNRKPPAAVIVATPDIKPPPGVPEHKRLVPNHTYSVVRVEPNGNVVLRNPWGPNGGYWGSGVKPEWYPGEVTLTPDEYRRAFSSGGVLSPPF